MVLFRSLLFPLTLASFLACQPSRGSDHNCLEREVCAEEKEINGAYLSTGKTNISGELSLPDHSGNSSANSSALVLFVEDRYTHQPLPEVEVTFVDGGSFSTFTLEKPHYISHFEVFPRIFSVSSEISPLREGLDEDAPDNPDKKNFSIVSETYQESTLFSYYFATQPEKVNALQEYQQWAENTYVYRGCLTKEEVIAARKDTLAALEIYSFFTGTQVYYAVLAEVYNTIVQADARGFLTTTPDEFYQVYEPLNFTAPMLFEGSVLEREVSDQIDNDCNGTIDDVVENRVEEMAEDPAHSNPSSEDSTPGDPARFGEPCADYGSCEPGLYCMNDVDFPNGMCVGLTCDPPVPGGVNCWLYGIENSDEFCFQMPLCASSSDCREGYTCADYYAPSSSVEDFCEDTACFPQ